jgi:hypothetical protein
MLYSIIYMILYIIIHLPITRITFVALGTVPVVTLRGGVRFMSFSVYAPLIMHP